MSQAMRFDVEAYLGRDEGQHFDRKSLYHGPPENKRPRNRKQVRDQVAEYCAAFANQEGGVLLLGIEDDGRVTGHGYEPDVVDEILRVPELRLDPPQRRGFRVQLDGREVLAFEVEMATVPVMVHGDGYPLRIGDQTVQVPFEKVQILKFAGVCESREAQAVRRSGGDLDTALLKRAMEGAGLQDVPMEEYLVRRRLADWRGPALVLRQAAELLFCRGLPDHPNAGVRVFRVVGTQRATGFSHNAEEYAHLEGPLPTLLTEVYETVQGLLRKPARLGPDGRFKPTWEYPEFSWREAILNAVAHRDYAVEGRSTEVTLFDDRMEVSSPGRLHQISLEDILSLKRVHASRNPRIVRVLVDLGYMRNQGEGIPRMFSEMEAHFLPTPEIALVGNALSVTLRNAPAIGEGDRALLNTLAGEDLSSEEFRALHETWRAGRVDNARLRAITGLDTLGASALLRGLRDRHWLQLHGAGGASYYTLGDALMRRLSTKRASLPLPAGQSAEHGRGEFDADGGELDADKGGLDADGGELDADGGELSTAPDGLTPSEMKLISALGTRPRRKRLREVILALASRRPWRPADLASVLGRKSVEKLTDDHLKAMVHDGLLRRLHPDVPTHPEQAYYAPQESAPLFDTSRQRDD